MGCGSSKPDTETAELIQNKAEVSSAVPEPPKPAAEVLGFSIPALAAQTQCARAVSLCWGRRIAGLGVGAMHERARAVSRDGGALSGTGSLLGCSGEHPNPSGGSR